MKIRNLFLMALAVGAFTPSAVFADDYVDDIYFNPKKDKNVGAKKKNPNYIENFADMDVDTYNLRGQYYSTPVDTIGTGVGAGEDFVYTQQIQKYYNPTIVLDNSQLLADVLQNSYGNVEIVYNGFTPTFLPVYNYGWPYYRGYYNPWAWDISFGGWSIGGWYDPWYWGPSWSWGWGPSWSWGPSWGWGPTWGPGPGWGPGPSWGHPNGTWSPGGNRPLNPGTGWAGNHRPAGNRPMATPSHPGNSSKPSSGSQWSIGGNHRGSYGQAGMNSNKQNAPANGNNRGYYIGSDGHRYTGNSANSNRNNSNVGNNGNNRNNSSVGNNRSSGNNSYNNSTRNSNSNSNSTRNSGSYNSGRSSGNGSFGSGSFGGSHRSSGGGGGGRGGRR